MSETTFEVEIETRHEPDGGTVVRVHGDLDLLGATRLHRPLADALAGPSTTVLDLADCGFCDSSGLRTILSGMRQARATGRAFRIAGAGITIVRVFEMTGLLTDLELYPDAETALKA